MGESPHVVVRSSCILLRHGKRRLRVFCKACGVMAGPSMIWDMLGHARAPPEEGMFSLYVSPSGRKKRGSPVTSSFFISSKKNGVCLACDFNQEEHLKPRAAFRFPVPWFFSSSSRGFGRFSPFSRLKITRIQSWKVLFRLAYTRSNFIFCASWANPPLVKGPQVGYVAISFVYDTWRFSSSIYMDALYNLVCRHVRIVKALPTHTCFMSWHYNFTD